MYLYFYKPNYKINKYNDLVIFYVGASISDKIMIIWCNYEYSIRSFIHRLLEEPIL